MTDEMEWDPKYLELPGFIRSTDEVSTAQVIQRVGHKRYNYLKRDCMQYKSDFVLSSIGNDFIEQDMDERIVFSVNVWKTAYKHSINAVVIEAQELVIHTVHSKLTPELISFLFGVGIPKAKHMLQKTTQRGLYRYIHSLIWIYIVDHVDLHINWLAGEWALDHLELRLKSIRGNVGAFLFANGNSVEAYTKPRKDQHDDANSLWRFYDDVFVPNKLKTDMDGRFEGPHT